MMRVVRGLWLLTIWLLLWSDLSVANVVTGALLALVIVVVFDTWRQGQIVVRPIRAAHFAGVFLVKLVQSTIAVALTVVMPRNRVRTGIVAVPLVGCSDAVATLIADAISLTPGTLTLEVRRDPLTLYVHALDVRDLGQLQRDVRTLEVLAIRAFGTNDAIAGLAVDDTESWRER